MTVGWLDPASGASGDMFLGMLVDAGVDLSLLQAAVDAVTPEPVLLRAERVDRAGLAATRVHVDGTDSVQHRHWSDIRSLLERAALPMRIKDKAQATFAVLAQAEAAVHGTAPEDVHFHEVGALDAIADVVGAPSTSTTSRSARSPWAPAPSEQRTGCCRSRARPSSACWPAPMR
jgi:uncharacterized protein (DUF111 family)